MSKSKLRVASSGSSRVGALPARECPSRDLNPLKPGDLVFIRYDDHVLFKDADASQYRPWTRETVGWLDYADEEFVRIVWERYPEPNFPKNARLRSTGLAIDRRTILEMRRFV